MTPQELQTRLKKFALRLVPLCEAPPNKKISRIVEAQLLRSGFSAAANYRSACNAQSKKSFNSKISIALEEIDETSFWLEIIEELQLIPYKKLSLVAAESIELTKNTWCFKKNGNQKIDN